MNSRVAKQTRTAKRGARVAARAFDDVNVVISSANAICLALGRFVFLPYQRAQVERVGAPTQNGQTHFAAGDSRAEEASFIVSTNDPAGFTIVDVHDGEGNAVVARAEDALEDASVSDASRRREDAVE